jgi:hypothetical protein
MKAEDTVGAPTYSCEKERKSSSEAKSAKLAKMVKEGQRDHQDLRSVNRVW